MHVEDLLIKVTSNMQGQVLEVANIDSLLSNVQCTTTDDLTSRNDKRHQLTGQVWSIWELVSQ